MMFRDDDGGRWVVKFYRPNRWSNEAIQEEHDFLTELTQAGVSVVAPWRNGQMYRCMSISSFALPYSHSA